MEGREMNLDMEAYAMSGLETHHLADLPENHLAG